MVDTVNENPETTVPETTPVNSENPEVTNVEPSTVGNPKMDSVANPEMDSLEKRQAELEAKERDINLKEYLAENNLPKEMFKELNGFDFEQAKKVISLINKHAKALSVELADKRFKDNGFDLAPKGSVTTKSYGEMSIKERIALKEQNPELYANLLSAYRANIK